MVSRPIYSNYKIDENLFKIILLTVAPNKTAIPTCSSKPIFNNKNGTLDT